MLISVELPNAIAKQLHLDGEQGSRRALEMLTLEGYRSAELSRGQVSELLDQSFYETEAFLKRHNCGLGLTFEEHEQGVRWLRVFLGR
jgi:hypothetical protein